MDEQLRTRASVIVGLLALLGSVGEAGAAPPPPPPSQPVALDCDMSVLDSELGARIQQQLETEIESVVRHVPSETDEPADSHQRILRIRVVAFDEDRRDYEVQIDASAGGETETLGVIRCEACSERRLVEVVVENIEPLITPVSMPLSSVPLPTLTYDSATKPTEPTRAPRGLARMGVAGAVLLGVGASASAVGGYLLVRGPDRRVDAGSVRVEVVDTRPWGATSLGIGAIVSGVGAALLATDLRRRQREGRSRVTPLLSPTFVGLQFRGRF